MRSSAARSEGGFQFRFQGDLQEAQTHYTTILPRLGEEFGSRVKAAVQSIIARQGGDHIGPQGFRCWKIRPFPHLVYYHISDDTLYVLGPIHERRHPDHLQRRLDEPPR